MKSKQMGLICILIVSIFVISVLTENKSEILKIERKETNNLLNPQSSSNDSNGNLLWNTTWGGPESDTGTGIAADGLGNVYITGYTQSYGAGRFDVFALKYDSNGNLLWNEIWGGPENDIGYGIAADGLGNVYITGYTQSYGAGKNDVFLLKYNSNGNLVWNKTWGGYKSDGGEGIVADGSGNVYITGYTTSYGKGTSYVILLKYDTNGNLLWNKTWGGVPGERAKGIASDGLGNIYITGHTQLDGEDYDDLFLLKYDSNGDLQWEKIWGGSEGDGGEGIVADGSGNVYIIGYTHGDLINPSQYYGVCLLKYDSNGNLQWNKIWGGSEGDKGNAIAMDGSGNIYITGGAWINYSDGCEPVVYDILLLKYDSNGKLIGNETWGGSKSDVGSEIVVDGSGNIYICGFTENYCDESKDVIFLKFKADFGDGGVISGYNLSILPWVVGLSIIYLYITKKRSINSNL